RKTKRADSDPMDHRKTAFARVLRGLGAKFGGDVERATQACAAASVYNPNRSRLDADALKEVERTEEALLEIRAGELKELQRVVAEGVRFDQGVARHIERIVYWTWSQEAVRRLTSGIEDQVSKNPDLAEVVSGVAQGASPRGAIALRDLSCALAWA